MRSYAMLGLAAVVAIAAFAAAVIVFDGDDGPARASGEGAPLAPRGVPATPVCATDPPGEGTEGEEARPVQPPLPDPDTFRPGAPSRAVAEYLDAWHDRAWDRMARWTSPSWRELVPGDAGRAIRRRHAAFRLRGWTITARERQPSSAEFGVLVAYRDLAPRITREQLRFVATYEHPDGTPATSGGRWGVLLSEQPAPTARCARAQDG